MTPGVKDYFPTCKISN